MTTITFDTLKYVDRLKEAGVPAAQAEAEARALAEALSSGASELATRHDLKELELRIDAKFETLKGELMLIKWMLGILLGGIAALVIKAFFPA